MNLNELNEAQLEAVECIDRPSLVIAGAGSGKTRVLTYKIAYLLENGFQPWNILALTFTNKAAREMQERIGRQVGPELARNLWMGTFHSIFSKILRIESAHLGFTSNFTIYDAADSKSLVKTIIRELQLDEKVYKPSSVCSLISEAKNRLIFPNQYQADRSVQDRDRERRMPLVGQIYLRYMQRCRLSDAMDFDDLLLYTYYLFDSHPEVRTKYQERFHYVLVDEYQDTNFAQHRIVWQLTDQRQRVCVVGDDAQSIYSFRGANIDNILRFREQYHDAVLFKLERNYRSTQTIVNAANSLIAHNNGQIKKDVYSEKSQGQPIRLYNVASDYEEAIIVASRIEGLHHRDHIAYRDIAILYRTNSQSRSLEESLRKIGLPYRIYGGLSFYQRKEIKDVIAYLRLSLNPRDEEALKRIINYPARGIGNTTLNRILSSATSANVSPWQVVVSPSEYGQQVNSGLASKLNSFTEMILRFHKLTTENDAYAVAREIVLTSGLAADINKGTDPDDVSRQENLQELIDGIASFVEEQKEQGNPCMLTDYLQQVSLLSDLDEDEGKGATAENGVSPAEDNDKVTLMTIHSAKGLEFRVVFVVGLEEELFPNQMALQEGSRGLEEERRLMYVAMTRAEEQLYLTTSRSRFRFGKTETCCPSRFLREVDRQYLSTGGGNNASVSTKAEARSSYEYGRTPFESGKPIYGFSTKGPSINRGVEHGSFSSSSNTGSIQSLPSNFTKISTKHVPTFKKVSGRPYDAGVPSYHSGTPNSSVQSVSNTNAPVASSPSQTGNDALKVGSVIDHARFGRGKVAQLEGSGIDLKATVVFENVGTKQLLLRFAKITVVS